MTSYVVCYLVLLQLLPLSLGKRNPSVSLDWTVLVLHDNTILQSSVNCLWLKLSIRKPKGENNKFQYSQDIKTFNFIASMKSSSLGVGGVPWGRGGSSSPPFGPWQTLTH